MEKKYIISESLVQGLLSYLVSRPYQEVENGVQALKHLEELKQEIDED